MAGDVALEADPCNPCCAQLMKKYVKAKEDRVFLKKGIKDVGAKINQLFNENAKLKNDLEELQLRNEREKEEKNKEFGIRKKLEKETEDLKAEISSLENVKPFRSGMEEENQLLKARISEAQEEVEKLKQLLDRERKRSDSEVKKSESDKKKAAEAWRLVQTEKKNAEEERKRAESERKKAEEYRVCLEKVKSEANELRDKLKAEQSRANDARKKVESEKLKVNIEKERADAEASKAGEWKRHLDVERKNASDEKLRANRLSQIVEEEKKKTKELQKKIQETVWTSKRRCDLSEGDEKHCSIGRANVELLGEKLKLAKKHVKHAKRMAKLEKAEKNFVIRELHLLKNSFKEILSRFNTLGDHISNSIEGTDAVAKIGNASDLHCTKLHDKFLNSLRGNHNSKTDNGLPKSCWTGPFNMTESTRECIELPLSRESCSRPTTGIVSELEPPVGGSIRKRSQNLPVCSSKSLSDKKSMGSQERDTVIQRSTVPTSSTAKKRKSEEKVIPKGAHKSQREVENVSLVKPTLEVADGKFDCSSKRRKVEDTIKPGVILPTKNQLHSNIREKSSVFKDVLNRVGGIPQAICSKSCDVSQIVDNKTTCQSEKQKEVRGKICNKNKQRVKIDRRGYEPFINETIPSSYQAKGKFSIEQTISVPNNERADLLCFEKMMGGNYLKLLNLDNNADEEKYRLALEMPLSPTLPEIEFSDFQSCHEDNSYVVMERDKLGPSNSVDVMNMELRAADATQNLLTHDSNRYLHPTKEQRDSFLIELHNDATQHDILGNIKHTPFPDNGGCLDTEQIRHTGNPGENIIDNAIGKGESDANVVPNSVLIEIQNDGECSADGTIISSSKNQALHSQTRKLAHDDKIVHSDEVANHGIDQLSEGSEQISLSACLKMDDSCTGDGEVEVGVVHVWSVVSPKLQDKDSISRMLCVIDAVTQNCRISQIENVILQVHSALAVNSVLMPEEKAGVLFSSLLCSITNRISANSACTMTGDSLQCLEFFMAETRRELPDAKVKSLLEEICQLDVLTSVIQSFLITRKVLLCTDKHDKFKDQSSDLFQLDGAQIYVVSTAATVDQFVGGCIILASITAGTVWSSFLLDTSYKILHVSRNGISWILLALHCFASVCGKEFFNFDEYSLLIIAIRSVVSYLEKGRQSVSSVSPFLRSVYDMEPSYHSCKDCPFAEGAVCIEKLIELLLDVLECYTLTGVGDPNVNTSVACSVCMVSSCTEIDEEGTDHKKELDRLINNSSTSCRLFKFKKQMADLPDCFPEISFCHFADVVSLVELVGCYMSWEWTLYRIMPRLLMMLESCINEEFSAALFVLMGQLGRFYIGVGGHEQKGIAEFRCKLSVLVDKSIARSLPTQVTAIDALLKLLPLSFKDAVGGYQEATLDTSQSAHAQLIKKWFSRLSHMHQSQFLDYFEPVNFQDCDLIA